MTQTDHLACHQPLRLPSVPSSGSLASLSASIAEITSRAPAAWLQEYAFYHRDRLALDLEWCVQNFVSGAKVLEVGGHPFFLTHSLQLQGYALSCVDLLVPEARVIADSVGLHVLACDLETQALPFAADTFDEVLFNEVFEHLRLDLIATVEEVLRVLKPGGRVWVSTPNLGSLKGMANLIFRNEAWAVSGEGVYAAYQVRRKYGLMGHVREYTSREVSEFLAEVGFVDGQVAYRGTYKNTFARTACRLMPRLLPYVSCIATKAS